MIQVMRRELRLCFTTPVAAVLVVFLVLAGVLTFGVGAAGGPLFERGQADLRPFFFWHPWLHLLLVPALAMRMWAEERREGTLELLLTLPLRVRSLVVGKFLAAWLFVGFALTLTFPVWVTIGYLGQPDHGVIAAAYLGSWVMAGGLLAVSAAASAATRSQAVAFVVGVLLCFLLLLLGTPPVRDVAEAAAGGAAAGRGWGGRLATASPLTHFDPTVSRGVLDLRDALYFLSLILAGLGCTAVLVVRARRT